MDANLVEKIVHEVKSQGVFDEFRKDSMSDVDTKPAYQNLRQRVENTVKKFLAEQKWTLETNKNQLREKLRKHITESGFLDVGVERIVDQVVNPKIGSVFQPRIEEIAYKYLGLPPPPKNVEPPPPPLMHPLPPLPLTAPPLKVETSSLLPTDLEQVSPDSDNATVISEGKDDRNTTDMDTDEKLIEDEDESPPFEPLVKQEEETKDDIKLEKLKDMTIKQEYDASSIDKTNNLYDSAEVAIKTETIANNSYEAGDFVIESAVTDKEASQSIDARISQDSQLSSVSSDSRLFANGKEDSLQNSSQEAVAANISEEAQMPKFNENSCEPNSTYDSSPEKVSSKPKLHFDIKKDEIKFEGTERKTVLEAIETADVKLEDDKYPPIEVMKAEESKNESFNFSTNKSNTEVKVENCDHAPNAQEQSFGSSVEDFLSVAPNQTPMHSAQRENDESPQIQTPKPTTRPVTPITTQKLPTSADTPSPVLLLKPDKDHQSRYSSSSSTSKHKKHSKERRKSHEREKNNSERHRSSKEAKGSSTKSSSSKHSSSSSSYNKYSSSRHKITEKDIEKYSSSTGHSSSKHTKRSNIRSSSSSNENQELKKYKRDIDRRNHSSSSSSSKRNENKDDHAEAKHKTQRRKSTDDDEDKSIGESKYKSSYSSSVSKSSKSNSSEIYKPSTSKTNGGQKDQIEKQELTKECTEKLQHLSNVIILNDILENPQTQFIELNNKGHSVEQPVQQQEHPVLQQEQHVQQQEQPVKQQEQPVHQKEQPIHRQEQTMQRQQQQEELQEQTVLPETYKKKSTSHEIFNKIEKLACTEEESKISCSADLIYFDEIELDVEDRLLLLNTTMDLCRSAVNSLRFDLLSDEETLKRVSDVNYDEFETTPRKRYISVESEGCQSKTSPTPSDTSSVNSKENEENHKHMSHGKKALLDRHRVMQKLTQQQRYSSDDLYKPRPVLGQRSRRRGLDIL